MSNEALNPESDVVRKTNPVAFLRGFFRAPQEVGSVIPSSRYLERQIIKAADLGLARLVVELGPGTGGTSRAFLREMRSDARLLTIEMSPHFFELLGQIEDSRLINHLGSAADLPQILREHNLGSPDVVISGIPFSTLPGDTGSTVIKGVNEVLSKGGRFVAYQFRGDVADVATPVLGQPVSSLEVRNIPPMRVFRWLNV